VKVLIIYDSVHGNTKRIAKAIGGAIAGDVKVLSVDETNSAELKTIDLFIVGSPTQGGRATPAIRNFLNKVSESSLQGINVAAFDTRISTKLVGLFGYAAGRIADNLKGKGGTLIAPPEGFFVKSTKGPLIEGELERAASWAKKNSREQEIMLLNFPLPSSPSTTQLIKFLLTDN
jgi:flavodoxin